MFDRFSIDFQVTLGSPWGRFGATLVSRWDHFGVTSGSLWSHFGVILGSLGLLWVYESYFGVILARFHEILIFPICFNDFIKVWGEFWIDLGLLWGHFW